MKKAFREKLHMSQANKERLELINQIIEQYKQQGYRLTLRQLYYQLVSKDIIPNRVNEYAKLSTLLVKGRMAGHVDWDAIEDRLRRPKLPYLVNDIPDAINDTIEQYRLDRMREQDSYIEVWVEKDALSNVLYRVTQKYGIRLMVNRGYSSCTAMHDAYKRFRFAERKNKDLFILYLGDFDPSGLDMIRDVTDRQEEFGVYPDITHIAITRAQIDKYSPPPNPAKVTDPRAKDYIREHGDTSWEVDALNPEILHNLLITKIESLIDLDKYNEILEQEKEDKEELKKIMKKYREDETDEEED